MIKVIHYGLGPIGCAMARLVAQRSNLQIVGAVDIDPIKSEKTWAKSLVCLPILALLSNLRLMKFCKRLMLR